MADTITTFIRFAVLTIAALLPIINPPGVAPIFLSMTPGALETTRATLARRVAVQSFVLLATAMLIGSYVLVFFGLSLAVVKIAGGLLVIATAWHLIRAEQTPDSTINARSPAAGTHADSQTFYPLTFPLTIGPGTISVAVTIGAGLRVRDVADVATFLGAVTGVLLVSASIYLCDRFAFRLLRVLGRTGNAVLLRLSAFILLCVGVQILCTGVIDRFDI